MKFRPIFLLLICIIPGIYFCSSSMVRGKTEITLSPRPGILMTETIQRAIDSCYTSGGGLVRFTAGTYLTGTIQLKSNITLQLDNGVIILGSDKYTDYQKDAFIYGKDISDIAIQGEGLIDGVDCYNPKGEEGFRGPHCIRLINCKNILIKGITIKNSANWAINCRYCSKAFVDRVSIRGGHDGLHTRFCDNFTVTGCDFRTGDDAFAGNDNRDFLVTDCKINTSCNGFRMGCLNLTVKHCKIWGPGESVHKSQKRNNMLSAFVHFSPKDENPEVMSGNWLIEDVAIDSVEQVYIYNFADGLWQTGQPVGKIHFKDVKATGVLAAFNIIGDKDLKFSLNVENSSFRFREGANYKGEIFEGSKLPSSSLFNARNFNQIELHNVILSKTGSYPIMICKSGNSLILDRVNFVTGESAEPYVIENVKNILKKEIKFNFILEL